MPMHLPTPLSTLTIRPMTSADLDSVLLLESASFSEPWTKELYAHELNDNRLSEYRVVVAADAHPAEPPNVIAQGGWMLFGEEAHILTIAVQPEFRGQGIGRWLMLALMEETRQAGCSAVALEVRPSNETALSLYESLGFRLIGRRKRYYPDKEDALVLLLDGLDDPLLWEPFQRDLDRLSVRLAGKADFGDKEV